MDQATLVKSDRDSLGYIMQILNREGIPVTFCGWHRDEELGEMELVVATPWYDSKGPREAFSHVIKALEDAGVYQDIPMRRVFVRSPNDPLVNELEQEIEQASDLREGFIHVLKHTGTHRKPQYSVIFAPFAGRGRGRTNGGSVPAQRFSGLEELRDFLDRRLHVGRSSIEDAMAELSRRGSASIAPVELTSREAKKLGLG